MVECPTQAYWIMLASAFATLLHCYTKVICHFSEVLRQEAGHFEMFFHGSPQLLFFRLQGQVQSVNLICFLRPRWLKGPLQCNNCHVFTSNMENDQNDG